MPATARHSVDVSLDGVRTAVSREKLADLARRVLVAERVPRALISIALISQRSSARMNLQHLGHRGATDVITFALGDDGAGSLVADVYICPDVAREQARSWGVPMREELARLVVHGVLHACGWEHPTGDDREGSPMWKRQELLLRRWLSAPVSARRTPR